MELVVGSALVVGFPEGGAVFVGLNEGTGDGKADTVGKSDGM